MYGLWKTLQAFTLERRDDTRCNNENYHLINIAGECVVKLNI